MTDYAPLDYEVADAIRLGKWAARSWPSVDDDDVVAELYLWLMEHQGHVLKYREQYRTSGAIGRNRLRKALQNHAVRYCSQQHRASKTGLAASTQSLYTLEETQAALAIVTQPGYIIETQDQQEYDILQAVLADVSGAYHGLSKKEQEVLALRYGSGLSFRHAASLLEVSVDIVRNRHQRAIKKLGLKLSGEGANWHRSPALIGVSDDDQTLGSMVRSDK